MHAALLRRVVDLLKTTTNSKTSGSGASDLKTLVEALSTDKKKKEKPKLEVKVISLCSNTNRESKVTEFVRDFVTYLRLHSPTRNPLMSK